MMFQSLGRDSVGFSRSSNAGARGIWWWFQSLGRDSVGFSLEVGGAAADVNLGFQSLGRDSVGFSPIMSKGGPMLNHVSIPRSGFCGV